MYRSCQVAEKSYDIIQIIYPNCNSGIDHCLSIVRNFIYSCFILTNITAYPLPYNISIHYNSQREASLSDLCSKTALRTSSDFLNSTI